MMDIKFIKENTDIVRETAKNKNIDVDIDRLLAVHRERLKLMQEIEQLKKKLQYERLDWEPADRMSAVKALCGRIEKGEYDVVVVLIHLCSHLTAYSVRMASKRSGVPYTTLNVGYGPESVRSAVEAAITQSR